MAEDEMLEPRGICGRRVERSGGQPASDRCLAALGYYTPEGQLIYAGRVGTGLPDAELERLWQRLQPLGMPLSAPPPRGGRFGSPLVLSRVHWVRPEMLVEVSYAEWTADGLLRHVVYLGEREDKPAIEVAPFS
jgi:ATP-dependent DNA ligase